jgi:hypothetical protein
MSGPSVQVATGTHMESSLRATVPLSAALSKQAQVGHFFDDLQGSLISIGQLCDNDCVTLFSKYHADIKKDRKQSSKEKKYNQRTLEHSACAQIRDESLQFHEATPRKQHDPQ